MLQALGSLPEQFFVFYGDVMLAVDLEKMAQWHLENAADFTTFAHPNDHPQDSDLIEIDAGEWVTAIHTCPHPENWFFANLVNAALYIVRRDALAPWCAIREPLDFTKNIVPGLIARGGRVLAYRSSEYIKDMGTPARLQKVEADWQNGKLKRTKSDATAPAVFLDRDGTLNVEKGFLRNAGDLELIAGAAAGLRALRHAGFRLVVLTNQPVIARGEASEDEVAAIHRRLEWELGKEGAYLDRIYLCPHHPDRGFAGERVELKIDCDCRKPATGLVRRAGEELGIDVARSWMIGDQTRDIEMARRAGMRSVLVRTGVAGGDRRFPVVPDHIAGDLSAAADFILRQQDVS